MAFQNEPPFADYLRQTARGPVFGETAPASNFLLDERVEQPRESAFLGHADTTAGWDAAVWSDAFGNHFAEHVGVTTSTAPNCHTFGRINARNHLALESNRDVVRLESVPGLFELNKTVFGSADELAVALRSLVEANQKRASLSANDASSLATWLRGVNSKRDARPMFATAFGEVEPLLTQPDWAVRIRNVLGLSHLGGTTGAPLPVVLMRYSLSRVELAAQTARVGGWASVPTVLEAGNHRGERYAAFFPFPDAARHPKEIAFGATVSLDPADGLAFKAEFLHFRLSYELTDFWRVGEITDLVDDAQLAKFRRRHLELLDNDFRYRRDVP